MTPCAWHPEVRGGAGCLVSTGSGCEIGSGSPWVLCLLFVRVFRAVWGSCFGLLGLGSLVAWEKFFSRRNRFQLRSLSNLFHIYIYISSSSAFERVPQTACKALRRRPMGVQTREETVFSNCTELRDNVGENQNLPGWSKSCSWGHFMNACMQGAGITSPIPHRHQLGTAPACSRGLDLSCCARGQKLSLLSL